MRDSAEARTIRWIASYPKSGSTWIRAFLSNYVAAAGEPVSINNLIGVSASNRVVFDQVAAVESSAFDHAEIDVYKPAMYQTIARRVDPAFIKVHEAYIRNRDGQPLFPEEVTHSAVYIVRNPLDVAVSFSHHEGLPIDAIIEIMCRHDAEIDGRIDRPGAGLRAKLLSWSENVSSWLDQRAFTVNVIRFEDLQQYPQAAFTKVVEATGLALDAERLQRAVKFSRFDVLQAQERDHGFRERSEVATASFFRSGGVGEWRDILTPPQAARIREVHAAAMKRFGYLNS